MFSSPLKHVVLLKSRAGNHGGLEKYASRIAQAFVERGARVSVLTTGTERTGTAKPEISNSPISFFPVKTAPWPGFLRIEQFDRFVQNWLSKNKADLIFGMDRNRTQTHFRAGNGVHAAYLESRVLTEGKMKRWLCGFNPLHRKILEIEKEAFENPSLEKLFTNSHMVRSQVLKWYATDPAKIEVIHNGVEWTEMESDFRNWQAKRAENFKKYDLDPGRFQFLFIGNGYSRKGLDQLLKALSKIPFRDFQLSVIGKDNQIDLYKAKAVQLGLKTEVRFFGIQPEIRPFYQMADVLVIPSFYDPFANVTIEALAMGLFVVSSKENGGHEILTKKNGAVIENLLDEEAILDALQTSLKKRKTPLSAELSRASVEHLDFSKQMRSLIEACGQK